MRAAAIFGPGCDTRHLKPFQDIGQAQWRIGMPATRADADALLIFGGDGTIHRHLAELVRLQVPLLIAPCGSGNDLARALGLRRRRDSLAAWRAFVGGAGNVRAIDLGVIQQCEQPIVTHEPDEPTRHYFCTVGGVGLDAEVARRANRLPRWLRGRGGYVLSLLPALWSFRPAAVRLQTGDEKPAAARPRGVSTLTAFANAPAYGGGMRIAPRARMDDGLIDVCAVDRVGKLKLLCLFPTVFFGRHLKIAEVEYFQAERLRLETEKPADVYADGEFVCRTPIEVSVARQALRVIVPR